MLSHVSHEEIKKVCPGGKKRGDAWRTTCPLCSADRLDLFGTDGVKCQHGCTTEAVIKEVRKLLAACRVQEPAKKPTKKQKPLKPYTLKEFATVKEDLPQDYLEEDWEVIDDVKYKTACVTYPWSPGVRQIRFGDGEKRWEGENQGLYGVEYIDKGLDYSWIVEGATDCHNLAFACQPVVASPSSSWRPEFAEHLAHCRLILATEDPPTKAKDGKIIESGKTFVRKVADSFPEVEVWAVRFWKPDAADPRGWTGYKDVNEVWRSLAAFGPADEHTDEGPFGGSEPNAERMAAFENELQDAIDKARLVRPGETDAPEVPDIALVCAADVRMTIVQWLWYGVLLAAKLNLFYGMPDQGKSTVAVDIIGHLTRGKSFPGCEGDPVKAASVIVCAKEDDWEDTYVPRLVAAGADLHRVHFVASSLDLSMDTDRIEKMLGQNPDVRLIIFDPVTSYVGEANVNRDGHVRPMLENLKALAKRTDVAILAITFFNKAPDMARVHRISGAGAWAQVPRACWAFVAKPLEEGEELPEPEERVHLMLKAKCNLVASAMGRQFRFKSVKVQTPDGINDAARIDWSGETAVSLDSVLQQDKGKPGPAPVKTQAAEVWLRENLTEPRLARQMFSEGEDAGHGEQTLREAYKQLGVKPYKVGKVWWWPATHT
jgi:hypothetical protein